MLFAFGIALFAGAFVCCAILCWIARAAARRVGFVDEPGERKIHEKPVALGGGIALFITTCGIVLGGVLFAVLHRSTGSTSWVPELLRNEMPRIAARATVVLAVLGGAAVMVLLGLLDDLWGLPPSLRLLVQATVAAALCTLFGELRVTAFVGHRWVSLIYTVVWVVGITNAFNLLDNMDGLSAGVALIACAGFFTIATMTGQYFVAAMMTVFAGSLLGFLVFNFPPATLFMGDAGSLFVGYTVAILTVLSTFYVPGGGANPVCALLAPLVVLAVPLYDTISVIIIRLAAGKPIFRGDKNHFSHRLVALGMGRRAAVLTIYLVTLCTGLLGPLLLRLDTASALLVFANVAMMLVLIWLLEHAGRRGRNGQGNSS